MTPDMSVTEKLLQIQLKLDNGEILLHPLSSEYMCKFIKYLSDDELTFLVELPLFPEVSGLMDHASSCKKCGDRIGRLMSK